MLSIALLLIAVSGGPAPEGAGEGDILEIDGVLYQVHGRILYTLDDPILEDPRYTITVTDSLLDDNKRKVSRTDVIDGAAIRESGARTLADVLEEQAGIQVNSSLGLGQEVQLDGLDGRHVLILIDGRPVNGKVNNRVDVGRIPVDPATIERIEIVRGPMSALYGSEALGGVINIVTKKPTTSLGGEVELGGQLVPGAWWTQVGLHGKGGAGPLALRLDLTANDLPGIDRDEDGKGDLADRRQFGVHAEAAMPILDVFSIRTTLDGNSSQSSARTSAAQPFRDRATNDEWSSSVQLQGDVLDGGELTVDLRVDRFRHVFDKLPPGDADVAPAFCSTGGTFFDAPCPAPPDLRTDALLDESRLEVRLKGPLAEGYDFAQELSAAGGAVISRQQARRKNGDDEDTLPGGGERDLVSLYGEAIWRPFTMLALSPGVRLDGYAPAVDGAQFALGPKIGARLDLPARVALRASYGRGFRLPSFEERFLRFDHSELGYIVEGNPDLLPESSHGVRGEVMWDPLTELSLSIEGYLNVVDNLITESLNGDVDGVPLFTYANSARAYTAGTQARVSAGPFYGARLDVSYQYLINAVDASACPESNPYFCSVAEGAISLPLRPAHSLDVNLRYRIEPAGTVLFTRFDLLSERPIDADTIAPSQYVLSAGVRQPFLDHFEAMVAVENIFDSYDAVFGPKPGRHLSMLVRAWY
jgi:outer membrane receptor for ferrienterochelin and colicins